MPKNKNNTVGAIVLTVILALVSAGFFFWKNKSTDSSKKIEKEFEKTKEISLDDIKVINPDEVYRAIGDDRYQLVDIREADEFELKHIELSVNMPISNIQETITTIPTAKIVVIIDRDETEKGKILTSHLIEEGVDARYLKGGILGYANEGHSIISKGSPIITEDLLKVNSISAEEFKTRFLSGENFAIIDTRDPASFSADNLPESINVPLEKIEGQRSKIPPGNILLVDAQQIRSFRAAVKLYDMHFLGVYNLIDNYETLKNALTEKIETSQP